MKEKLDAERLMPTEGHCCFYVQVNLIAPEFFGERMRRASNASQFASYLALFAGAGVMCVLAKWA